MSAQVEEAVLRARVVTNEWSHAPITVKRIATAFIAFLRDAQSGTLEDSERSFDKLLQEIDSYDFALARLELTAGRCREEADEYRALHKDIDTTVGATTAKLEELKRALEAAKLERTQRQQYEDIAREINKRPSREALNASITSVQDSMAAAVLERTSLDARIASRRSQFQLLFSAIADLQRTFVEESETEQRRLAAAAASAAMDTLIAAGSRGEAPEEAEEGGGRIREEEEAPKTEVVAEEAAGEDAPGEVLLGSDEAMSSSAAPAEDGPAAAVGASGALSGKDVEMAEAGASVPASALASASASAPNTEEGEM